MNHTKTNATNQRIERITTKHAVVGVDIAKDVHAAQITDFRGRVLTSHHLSFNNSEEGFERFLRFVQDVKIKNKLSSFIIGMEPTGHYWFNFANWLHQQGIEVVMVNPVTTHRNKENRDNSPSKNDPKDALVIADVVSRGYYTDYNPQTAEFERLKAAVSEREYWVKQSVSLTNRIIRWIDLYFPEYRRAFPNWTAMRSIATLRAFPLPCDLNGLNCDQVIEQWREQGMKRAGGTSGKAKAVELLLAAKRSIGHTGVLKEARMELKRLLLIYEQATVILDELEQEIEALLGDIPMVQQLQSVHGLGNTAIATILGCAGDLRNYAHGRQFLRRAGLNLAECTSGKHKGQIKLSKRGDSVLRKHLFLATLNLVRVNPEFQKYHEDNVKRKGMKKMASIFKLLGKLARILVGIVQRGETYRPEQVAPAAA